LSGFVDNILNVSPLLALLIVGLLVFAEDALFIGFIVPGETAAILGGVVASRGNVPVLSMIVLVVLAAVIGDTVGYEVGKHLGPRFLDLNVLNKRRAKLQRAQDFLRRRGGMAVFLGRFVAFFRAVMPALAGTSGMRYPKFLVFNVAGGLVWGAGCVLLGFVAGNSYQAAAKTVGRDVTAVVVVAALVVVITWRIRRARAARVAGAGPGTGRAEGRAEPRTEGSGGRAARRRRSPQLPRLASGEQDGMSVGCRETRAMVYVGFPSEKTLGMRVTAVATDYDEVRSDVKESQEHSLQALQSANAPDARSVVRELDEADAFDDAIVPGGEFVSEELVVQVIPQAQDEFTCYSCFLVRHRSQLALEKNGHAYCVDCEG
jgi:membrane protein DedA with SNARE-associated domain